MWLLHKSRCLRTGRMPSLRSDHQSSLRGRFQKEPSFWAVFGKEFVGSSCKLEKNPPCGLSAFSLLPAALPDHTRNVRAGILSLWHTHGIAHASEPLCSCQLRHVTRFVFSLQLLPWVGQRTSAVLKFIFLFTPVLSYQFGYELRKRKLV